jgi:hypothetical protein
MQICLLPDFSHPRWRIGFHECCDGIPTNYKHPLLPPSSKTVGAATLVTLLPLSCACPHGMAAVTHDDLSDIGVSQVTSVWNGWIGSRLRLQFEGDGAVGKCVIRASASKNRLTK